MARPVRIEFKDAVYHVMARGNERRPIFLDDRDRTRFLETLAEAVEQFGVVVHAYCLMPNHYHLVVQTPRGNLSRALGWLQTTYTIRFNRRYRRSGHLFQGRFKAQLVDAEEYGRWLVQYVHLNPVRPLKRDELIPKERRRELDRYAWSSHRAYAGLGGKAEWLSLEWLRFWDRRKGEAQRRYGAEMAGLFEKPVANPWEHMRGGLVLGAEELWKRVKGMVEGKAGQEEVRWQARQGAKEWRERVRRLVAGEKDDRVVIWARVRLGGERGVDVAREYGYRDGAGVSLLVTRLEAAAKRDRELGERLAGLKAKCKE